MGGLHPDQDRSDARGHVADHVMDEAEVPRKLRPHRFADASQFAQRHGLVVAVVDPREGASLLAIAHHPVESEVGTMDGRGLEDGLDLRNRAGRDRVYKMRACHC